MARRARTARTAARGRPDALERRLILLSWLHARLGYADTAEALADARAADEGAGDDGRSRLCERLSSRSSRFDGIAEADLTRYDANVSRHLAAMNAGRREPVVLRCFQRLAALYAEMFLDARFNRAEETLTSLNRFAASRPPAPGEPPASFERSDLNKLAFWMATGSGKTLLLHINLRQFRHYKGEPPDNIILITPNEGLSAQHLAELAASNIPAARFEANGAPRLPRLETDAVSVTEITKLVLEKSGEGESVPVEALEGDNLILVDEGHKGAGGDAWRKVREALGETGFTFEYSATFGQALTAARNDRLTAEYGKAIAFDYSYRHFYNDGFGKDFRIINLRQADAGRTDELLLANLLSFYQRQRLFAERADDMRPYNPARPLWTLAGSKVNAVYTEKGVKRSDALTVARFLQRFLTDPAWSVETVSRLLAGESGLRDGYGVDVFADKFGYLREVGAAASDLRADMLARTFHAPDGGALRMAAIRGADGELGLKAGGADDYFGLIYIGDVPAFRKLVEADGGGIGVEDDAFAGSLFESVNEPGTTIELLIGAKKFMEGWNSWRVSNMGLLNIGRSEGSQIIQMFGRGVRLRGRGMSLKRGAALAGVHPAHLDTLETLDIFAVRANYMSDFRDYLEREGVDTGDRLELALPIQPNRPLLKRGLLIPRIDEGLNFKERTVLPLKYDAGARPVSVDVSARAETLSGARLGEAPSAAASGGEMRLPSESLDLVDWNAVYADLMRHKTEKGYDNLLVRAADLREILERADPPAYALTAEESLARPADLDGVERLRETVSAILRKYADALYRRRHRRWESDNMVYKPLDEHDSNLKFNIAEGDARGRYIVHAPRENAALIAEIERLIADCDSSLYKNDYGDPPRIHFDRHLYQPLPLKGGALTFAPQGLAESERRFVADLREFWRTRHAELPDDAELFLLRNQSRGAGVGFFESAGFYPDFILWIKTNGAQRIVFIEPHGMIHEKAYDSDDKAKLHERLPQLASEIARRSPDAPPVVLDSFIISATPYQELREKYDDGGWSRERFAKAHILFADSGGYVGEIMAGGKF